MVFLFLTIAIAIAIDISILATSHPLRPSSRHIYLRASSSPFSSPHRPSIGHSSPTLEKTEAPVSRERNGRLSDSISTPPSSTPRPASTSLMGEHAYVDHSSGGGGMSPSTPPVQQRRQQRRGSSYHATAPRAARTRPAIRIIHIIAPEIIKTDVDNFRDLVQRLTGRHHHEQPADESTAVAVGAATTPPSPAEEKPQRKRLAPAPVPALADDFLVQQENKRRKKIKCEVVKVGEGGFSCGGGDLDFSELWMDLNPGGFLSFLEEDIFQDMMAPDLLQQPLGAPRMDLVGEMCASYLA
ncbi:VQ motif-containing protein 25 [Hordeum vulgare]|nr:VQ motif-containing protein 25 [Hordeum vulgare]